MKKTLLVLLTFLFLIFTCEKANAVLLSIGDSVTPVGTISPGGTLLETVTVPFAGLFGEIGGSVTQNVLQNSDGILFEYLVNSTGDGDITQVTASFYDIYSTDVDGPIAPYSPIVDSITRGANGDTITWNYIGDAILTGEASGTLWVQTNAPWYGEGGFSLIGADTDTKKLFGPAHAVPEPTTLGLLGFGLIGLVSRKLKNKWKSL